MHAPSARSCAVSGCILFLATVMLGGCENTRLFGGTGLEGTYQLVSRELPDGTTVEPPAIQGLFTYTSEYRNFNVTWTEGGDRLSICSISEYVMTDDRYIETNLYYMINDQISGEGIAYDLSRATGVSHVTREAGATSFDLPLHDEPSVVFTRHGFTATREGEFVDHWEKVD